MLRLFGAPIAAICEAARQGAEVGPNLIVGTLVTPRTLDAALDVLRTCVHVDGASLEECVGTDVRLAQNVALAVASLTDPLRIIEATGLDRALDRSAPQPAGEATPDADIDAVCVVAEHFHCTPLDVLEWPYLAFLSAGEHLARLRDRAAPQESGAPSFAGQRFIDLPGVVRAEA